MIAGFGGFPGGVSSRFPPLCEGNGFRLDIPWPGCSELAHPPSMKTEMTRGRNENVKTEIEAAVVSIHENTNDRTARVNLRWEGKHQISDFALEKLGTVLNSEGETARIADGPLLNCL